MRRRSKKTQKRIEETSDWRDWLRFHVGQCEVCGVKPKHNQWLLDVHEIARGPNRLKALDKPYAVLVLCRWCHMDRIHGNETWPEARQLWYLRKSRPSDFDLVSYNKLIGYGPDRITVEDVDQWTENEKN